MEIPEMGGNIKRGGAGQKHMGTGKKKRRGDHSDGKWRGHEGHLPPVGWGGDFGNSRRLFH